MPEIFSPQNCGAVANTLHVTGRVEDDPRLSRLYNRFGLQGDRSITTAERAADRELARLNGTRLGDPRLRDLTKVCTGISKKTSAIGRGNDKVAPKAAVFCGTAKPLDRVAYPSNVGYSALASVFTRLGCSIYRATDIRDRFYLFAG